MRYAGASGDFNPMHHDQTFAEKAGLPTVFAHGMLNAGFVSKCITDYVGRENLRKFKVRFATRVWPGDTITCKGTVTKKYEAGGKRIDRRRSGRAQPEGRDGDHRELHRGAAVAEVKRVISDRVISDQLPASGSLYSLDH